MQTASLIVYWATELAETAPQTWRQDVAEALEGLDAAGLRALEQEARTALAGLPVALHAEASLSTRRVVERLAAQAAERSGRPEALLGLLRDDWLADGGRLVPYLECLLRHGRTDAAAAFGRLELAGDTCRERERIQALVDSLGAPPDGWHDAIAAFARAPSVESWDDLMRFTPEEVHYQRKRNTLRALMDLGVDGDLLFQCASRDGTTPEAIELIERGLVAPQTVAERARTAAPLARCQWFGLAAQAAHAHGDQLGTVRLLRDAVANATCDLSISLAVGPIRELADDALHAMLDAAGLPR